MSTPPDTPERPQFYRGDRWQPDDSIGLLMRQVMQSLIQQVDRRLVKHDLTHAQWVPLYKLAHGECATMAELARALQFDPASMTRALDRLEAKGLVQRVRSQSDRRVVNLELTPAGHQVASEVPAVLADVLNAHLVGFTEPEWRQLVSLLQRVRSNGEQLRLTPGPADHEPAAPTPKES